MFDTGKWAEEPVKREIFCWLVEVKNEAKMEGVSDKRMAAFYLGFSRA